MKIYIKTLSVILLLSAAFLAIIACSRKSTVCQNLPATILWKKDQVKINPSTGSMNVWEGLAIKENFFEAIKNRSRFIFWKNKSGRLRFRITYILKSNCAILICNEEKVVLRPATTSANAIFHFKVKEGFNFLEIAKQSKDTLRISAIRIGNAIENGNLLRASEQLIQYFPPGAGTIFFNGNGTLVIEKAETKEGKIESEARKLQTSLFKKELRYDFSFSRMGFLKIEVPEGSFDIHHYDFREKKVTPLPATVVTGNKPDIYIFLPDACQAKHITTYGYGRKTSPAIDSLARDSIVFENAYANSTFTPSSVSTIFSGLYPERHKVRIQRNRFLSNGHTLPEFLKSLGYHTAVFSANPNVSPRVGFGQGVDDFILRFSHKPTVSASPVIAKCFQQWLDTPAPRFAYLHFAEPHWPWLPSPPFLNMFKESHSGHIPAGLYGQLRNLENSGHHFSSEEVADITADYDSAIAYIDSQLGKMWQWMREHHLYDESVIILLSDHGEALYEHRVWSHGVNVFDETTHVPLIVKLPRSLNLKGRITNIVQLVDIFPTIVGLLGKTLECDGRNALNLFGSKRMDDTFAISRTQWYSTGEKPATYSMRWCNWYYLLDTLTNKAQLYRLDGDSQHDVILQFPQVATLFLARFLNWYKNFEKLDTRLAPLKLPKMSPEEIKTLKSLGYL